MAILGKLAKALFGNLTADIKKDSIGIHLTGKAIDFEEQKCKEIAERTIKMAQESGLFKDGFIPVLAEKIRTISRVGYGYSEPFDKTDCLSLKEKKDLKLNTRRKYSRELINGLTEKGIEAVAEKEIVKTMFLQNFHKVSREYDLKRMEADGIKYVEILDCGDERDCKAIKRLKKHYQIDEVPELPLPQCKADYCRCSYIADKKNFQ